MAGLKKGAEVELEIESLAFGADGVGRVNGMVVFVQGALPGQRVRAKITRKKKSHAYARILDVLRQSPDYQEPECVYFGDCGGCALQHLKYDRQIEIKTRQVQEVLQHIGGFADVPVLPALPSPKPFFYRNKMEFTFSPHRWLTRREVESGQTFEHRHFALGLHVRGRFDKTLALKSCLLQSKESDAIRNFVAGWAADSGLPAYTTRDHIGFWRFLVIREGKRTGERLVNIITADGGDEGREAVQRLTAELIEAMPEITTVVHTINRSKAQVATGDESEVLHGPGYIHERIGAFRFRISPESFFQTNTEGAEVLYQTALDFAQLTGNETLYDLYCGAGTIGIFMSPKAGRVIGVEIVPEAVQDAETNAELNSVANCTFVVGDLKEHVAGAASLFEQHGHPDVVVLDPPRAGIHPRVVQEIVREAPPRIVYVSCNPSTFARDARLFCDGGYRLLKVQPVDMFPHTAHIEVVGLFER